MIKSWSVFCVFGYCSEHTMMGLVLVTNPMKCVLLYPFYGGRNGGTESLRNLLEVM